MFKSLKSLIKIFTLALITVIIGGIFIKLKYNKIIETPNSDSSEKITITINEGQAVDLIIDELIDAGVIKESWRTYLKTYLKLNDLSSKIQAGTYNLPLNLNIIELIESLQHADSQDIWITIPEGLRKDEIADTLAEEFLPYSTIDFSSTEFLSLTTDSEYISQFEFNDEVNNLEGYIFPDKYAFSVDSTTQSILTKMITTFVTKVGTNDTYEDIIIASMVEREGYNSTDRAIIADIIKRRYSEGWLLQIDATLLYPVKDWKHVITQTDKNSENPYNTYKYPGLVPTPICNPGLEAINATRNPKPNNYYYYIHEDNGTPHYSTTLNEHNANVNQYLR
ncbi:endolytic transglycosylase MltG [bacterium]|nr:endolytic transglycosylase MltG [bacterium]